MSEIIHSLNIEENLAFQNELSDKLSELLSQLFFSRKITLCFAKETT